MLDRSSPEAFALLEQLKNELNADAFRNVAATVRIPQPTDQSSRPLEANEIRHPVEEVVSPPDEHPKRLTKAERRALRARHNATQAAERASQISWLFSDDLAQRAAVENAFTVSLRGKSWRMDTVEEALLGEVTGELIRRFGRTRGRQIGREIRRRLAKSPERTVYDGAASKGESDVSQGLSAIAKVANRPTLSSNALRHGLSLISGADASREFRSVLRGLEAICKEFERDPQTRASARVFLSAINNKFAMVAARGSGLSASATRYRNAKFEDLASLPTTHGLLIDDESRSLTAWQLTDQTCDFVTVKLDQLHTSLIAKQIPVLARESIYIDGPIEGVHIRRLMVVARRKGQSSGLLPLRLDGNGNTVRDYGKGHKKRMGSTRSPHQVREHTRRMESGKIALVTEHERNKGFGEWKAMPPKLYLFR